MKFCYRGARYSLETKPVATVDSGITGKFMGQTYSIRQTHSQNCLSGEVLKYRGIVYQH
ncbi:MAG: DUF4278 domain-containing protein [Cyanobacteria bacterium P01_G01_bin.19]